MDTVQISLMFIKLLKTLNRLVYTLDMDNTQKMLQAIINGQSALKQELSGKIDRVDQKVDALSKDLKKVEQNLTKRIDKLGKQLAYLEDDTPTREEYDQLEKRVDKIEQRITPV